MSRNIKRNDDPSAAHSSTARAFMWTFWAIIWKSSLSLKTITSAITVSAATNII